jgi:hypothetical protein
MANILYYSQSSGEFYNSVGYLFTGYSGYDIFKNKPEYQFLKNYGCIPSGVYTIQKPAYHPVLGSLAFPLAPSYINNMHNRFGFYIHGPSPKFESSRGCIILPNPDRQFIVDQAFDTLIVIS